MMIECVQQIGYTLGERQVFDFDKVYLVDGETRVHLGIVGHAEGVHFLPRIKLTDAEKAEAVKAINAHRAKYGRGPIADKVKDPMTIGQVAAIVAKVEQAEGDDE